MRASPETLTLEPRPDTPASARAPAEPESARHRDQDVEESLYLIGRPPLKYFLRFVKHHAVNPPGQAALTDAWQAAYQVVRRLEAEEPGIADDPPIGKLGPEYEPLLEAIEFAAVRPTSSA